MLPPSFEQRLRVLRVIWISQLVAILMFAAVAAVVTSAPATPATSDTGTLHTALTAFAAILAVASLWWRKTRGGRAAAGVRGDSPREALEKAFSETQTHCVIVWALCEGVGIVGLVLALLSGDAIEGVPFFAAAALLMVAHRPSRWRLEPFAGHIAAAGVSR